MHKSQVTLCVLSPALRVFRVLSLPQLRPIFFHRLLPLHVLPIDLYSSVLPIEYLDIDPH